MELRRKPTAACTTGFSARRATADGQSVILQQRAAREGVEPLANRLGENGREPIIFRRRDEQGLSGDWPSQQGIVGAARFQR